jgi:hypothetical protein
VLIQRESARKLSGLSGKQPDLKLGRRRWILLVSELGQEAAGSPTAPCCLLEADCKPSSEAEHISAFTLPRPPPSVTFQRRCRHHTSVTDTN